MLQEYEAVANGFGGVIRLKVEVDANKIISVDVLESSETEGIGTRAIEDMPQMFIDANSTDIDIIAGCTVTSNAMKEMVQNARNQAMGLSLSSELNMKGGVYKPIVRSYAEVNGLATGDGSMTIEVTIEDNNIKNIDVLD